MAAVLASQSYCCQIGDIRDHRRLDGDISFSSSSTRLGYSKSRKNEKKLVIKWREYKFQVKMQDKSSPKNLGENSRRVIEMVPTSEIKKRMSQSKKIADNVNGSPKHVNGSAKYINGEHVISEAALVKKDCPKVLSLVKQTKSLPSNRGPSRVINNFDRIKRNIDIWAVIISFHVRWLLDDAKWSYIGGFTEDKKKRRMRKTASWLRDRMLELGATLVKLGQLCSTRSDLFPKEYIEELAKLQDRVPAFSPIEAKKYIEFELGSPVHVLFKEFEDTPIAAASLGQVHKATLHNGDVIVVKVQRRGLKELFDIDLRNLKMVCEYFQRSEAFGGPGQDWIGIHDECSKILYQEIDYVNEAKNADRFRRDFRNIKWVRVPMVYWEYTSMKVLTLEYVPGVKLNQLDVIDARGYSRTKISSRAVEAYMIQILKTGFFHADPHPGNLAIDKNEALIYYDFGMMGDIKGFTRERLLQFFYAMYERDAKKVMQRLIDLGVLQSTGDLTSVRRTIQFFLDNTVERPDREKTISEIGEDLYSIATDQPFRFPSTFAFLLRAFTTLEGIGYSLDPKFSFMKIAAPYAQELLDSRQQQNGAQIVQEISKAADDATSRTMSMPYRIQQIEDIVKQLESGDIKLRVRVLESERAAKKANILQMATIYTVLFSTFLNLGMTVRVQRINIIFANASFLTAGIFFVLFLRSMQRVKGLDKIEKII